MKGKEWWRPETCAARRPRLMARARILAALRGYFAAEDFLEVETPCLQVSPGQEPHIMALSTTLSEPLAGGDRRLYLHTSPEFAMKKLLVAGLPRIVQFARVWRDGERSATHHPEFTMLEWYRAGDGCEALMTDCAALLKKRTLTNLYNERPAWLDLAHKKLDVAVAAAYGWVHAGQATVDLSDEAILEQLLALNLERAAEEAKAAKGKKPKAQREKQADEMV